MKKFKKFQGKAVTLNVSHIDTDQIIPARFLKTTGKTGLGQYLFSDWRKKNDVNTDFILNQNPDAKIIIAADNFGCGSSREHASWALMDFGIEVVVSSSIAEIFKNNAFKNGLLAVEVSQSDLKKLMAESTQNLIVDLENQQLINQLNQVFAFQVESFRKECLLKGLDELDYILKHINQIEAFERTHYV